MSAIAEFIEAQYRRIEEVALASERRPWLDAPTARPSGWVYVQSGPDAVHEVAQVRVAANATHIAIHDPAFVLADIDSKRQVLSLHRPESEGGPDPICNVCLYTPPCETVRALAAPFSGEPGYKEDWAVE